MDLEIDKKARIFDLNKEDFEAHKSSLRIQYEAQVTVIKSQIGELEFIRAQLGLSQRKISQLLLINPSSWNRWIKDPDKIPSLVWRSLQWYLALNDKVPGLNSQYFLSQNTQSTLNQTISSLQQKQDQVRQMEELVTRSIESLKSQNQSQQDQLLEHQKRLKNAHYYLIFLGMLNLGLIIYLLSRF